MVATLLQEPPLLTRCEFATDALSVVPAPGAMALLGLAGLAGLRRRRA